MSKSRVSLLELFLTFAKVGVMTFGGVDTSLSRLPTNGNSILKTIGIDLSWRRPSASVTYVTSFATSAAYHAIPAAQSVQKTIAAMLNNDCIHSPRRHRRGHRGRA